MNKEVLGAVVTIKFLRKTRSIYMLVPYHVSPRYDVIPLSGVAGDAIIGKVLTWITEPPKMRK